MAARPLEKPAKTIVQSDDSSSRLRLETHLRRFHDMQASEKCQGPWREHVSRMERARDLSLGESANWRGRGARFAQLQKLWSDPSIQDAPHNILPSQPAILPTSQDTVNQPKSIRAPTYTIIYYVQLPNTLGLKACIFQPSVCLAVR